MIQKDPRIDAYIAKSAAFARPILKKLRAVVHRGCPEAVETIKWGSPHFEHHGMLCGMAAFKAHCAFGFWNRALKIPGKAGAMGQFGSLRSVADLPADRVLVGYVREAARLNATGQKLAPIRRAKKPLPVPKVLTAALAKRANAQKHFAAFSPSQKREYSEWILDAKTDATRSKRLETAVAWIGEGKTRMWKYRKAGA
ncbi:MAG TPA: YdeI/OmpD-associated family protein [Thermoanaerobaculia bacterium]